MAGWLGSSLASQLGNIKSQVSSMAKDVFVEDGEQERGEARGSEVDILRDLHNRCKYLESLNEEAVLEKEAQCENFRQLLLEKEEEILELQQMLDTEPELEDSGGGGSKGEKKLRERNKKLQAECDKLKNKLKEAAVLEAENKTREKQNNQLMEEKEKLMEEKEKLTEEKEKLTDQIMEEKEKLTEEKEKLTEEKEKLTEEKEKLAEEKEELAEEKEKLAEEKEKLAEENEKLTEEKEKMIEENKDRMGELKTLRKLNQDLEKETENLKLRMETQLEKLEENHAKEIKAKSAESELVRSKFQEQLEKVMKYNEEQEEEGIKVRRGLEEELTKMKINMKDLEVEFEKEKSSFMKQMEEMQQRLTDQKEEKDEDKQKQDDINGLRPELSATLSKMESEQQTILSKLAAEESVNSELRTSLETNRKMWEEEKLKLTCDQTQTHEKLNQLQEKLNLLQESKDEETLEKVLQELDESRVETKKLKEKLSKQNLLLTDLVAEKKLKESVLRLEKDTQGAVNTSNNNGVRPDPENPDKYKELLKRSEERNKDLELMISELKSGSGVKTVNGSSVDFKKCLNQDDIYDITSLVEENRDLKQSLHQILQDKERKNLAERKLEAGELSILLKMKNVDLEQKYFILQQENSNLTIQNSELRTRSETSSVFSFPSIPDAEEAAREQERGREQDQESIRQLEQGKEELTTLLEQSRSSWEEEREKLAAKLSEAKKESEVLNIKLLEETSRLETQQEKNAEHKSTIESNLEKISRLESEIIELQAQLADGQQRLTDSELIIVELNERMDSFNVELESKTNENEVLRFNLGDKQLETVKLSQLLQELELERDGLKNELSTSREEVKQLSKTIEEEEVVLTNSNEAIFSLKNEIETLQGLVSRFQEAEVGKSNQEKDERENVIQQKDKELEEAHLEYSTLMKRLETETSLLTESKEDCQDLREQITSLNTEIDMLKDQFEMNLRTISLEKETKQTHLETELESTRLRLEETLKLEESSINFKLEIRRLESLLEEKVEKEKELEEKILILQQEIASFGASQIKLAEKNAEMVNLKESSEELKQALTDLKGMNELFLNRARDTEKELKLAQRNLTELENANLSLDQEVSELRTELNSRLEKEQKLETLNQNQVQQISELRTELNLRSEEEHRLENLNQNHLQEISGLRAELNLWSEKVHHLELKLVETKSKTVDSEPGEEQPSEKHLVQVLNEKTRELSQLRTENSHLHQLLETERDKREELEQGQSELRDSYGEMKNETIKKLSNLVKDKELEIQSLTEKNKSILEILHAEKQSSVPDLEKKLSVLETENRGMREELKKIENLQSGFSAKDTVQHANELLYLKGRIVELEKKLNTVGTRKTIFSEVLEKEDSEIMEKSDLQTKPGSTEREDFKAINEELQSKISELLEKIRFVEADSVQAKSELSRMMEERKNDVSEKNLEYISECQRLRGDMRTLAEDKTGLETKLAFRENEVRDLHREVKSVIDKKKWVEGEVERLRAHLVQVEEGYTQELMQGEEREQELRMRVGQLEDRVKKASLTHSEASQEASEATSSLTEALTAAASSRDSLSEQLKVSQTKLREKTSSLRNLQLALEGFQRQKENEIRQAERRCSDKVEAEQRKCTELTKQLEAAKLQLERAGEGLEAATRLSQQLDAKQQVIAGLKHEVLTREELLQVAQEKLKAATTAQVGRVDRELVKNLMIGYVTADYSKKAEILRVVATVLDFNQDERGKTGLSVDGAGWLGGFLRGRRESGQQKTPAQINESIAQAFVKFLEEESVPQTPIQLPVLEMARSKQEQLSAPARSSPSPLLLNPLPTLSPSPNILQAVLADNEKK